METAPSCSEIDRACRLYSAGASSHDIRDAFPDASEQKLALLWTAAQVAFAQDEWVDAVLALR